MKRLKAIFDGFKNSEAAFTRVYEGPMIVCHQGITWGDDSAAYYDGDNGFTFERSARRIHDRPTVVVSVPAEELLEENILKRLIYYFLKMEKDTATYTYRDSTTADGHRKSMYDGEMVVHFADETEPEVQKEPRFFDGETAFSLSTSGKSKLDLPTVTAEIPAALLGIEPPPETLAAAVADALLREFARFIAPLNEALYNRARPDTENGRYYLFEPGGEVLPTNAAYFAMLPRKDYRNGSGISVYILPEEQLRPPCMHFCIRMQVQLPAKKIKKSMQMLTADLPAAVQAFVRGYDRARIEWAAALAEKQAAIRAWLAESEYCAFAANGAILPRDGETQLPKSGALPFASTPGDEIEAAGVRGMGIRRGVTVITGGGYSGKSTLLDALAAGIYDHHEGDGRELVITDASAVSIAAEDGRSVKRADISPFLGWLPMGGDTTDFSTAHASGSTSQAANIVEAAACGAKLLLIDEDRSATNFMIRDDKMKRLIEREPITPLTDRVRELSRAGISTVLVIGGSGEYLSVADRVYMMDDFKISDATDRARALAPVTPETAAPARYPSRLPKIAAAGFTSYPESYGAERLAYSETGFITIGREYVDTRAIAGLVSPEQANALAFMLRWLMISNGDAVIDLSAALDALYAKLAAEGLDAVWTSRFEDTGRFLALPRRCDAAAAILRMRGISVVK